MLDISLASRLLDALPPRCVVLLVGDADQLPSVGPGSVLGDLLKSPRVPRIDLDQIFRQDPAGDIARNAALVNTGAVPRHFRRLDATQLRSSVASRHPDALPPRCIVLLVGGADQ